MTNWNDKGGAGEVDSPDATMIPDQFKIIFQVTKEFHSIPESRLQEERIPIHHPSEIIEFARIIRRSTSAGRVRVFFISPDSPDSKTLAIEDSADAQSHVESKEFPYATARHWWPLINLTVASLGPKELMFRTGYRQDEIDAASSPLNALFSH
ncbi:hypothetical protein AB0N60_04190 [Streptomyces microflavus]|uniref:hypothetical protein n=1 Tax=Streptomyces microflavus TaxID=1919 RepID=UPI0034342A06